MRVVVGGCGLNLQELLDALCARSPSLAIVAQARSEGELFLDVRIHRPDLIVVDASLRPTPSTAWKEYLQALCAGAKIIWIDSSADLLAAVEAICGAGS